MKWMAPIREITPETRKFIRAFYENWINECDIVMMNNFIIFDDNHSLPIVLNDWEKEERK